MTETIVAEITDQPILPEQVVKRIKTANSGCVATYVGLIRDNSHGKAVVSVEYRDDSGKAREGLAAIAKEKGLLQDNFSLDHLESSFFSGSVLKQDNIKELVRLQKLFYIGVKMPWTQGLIAHLIKYPFDRLFYMLFALSFTWRFMQETEIGFWNALKFAFRHRKNL